MDNCWDYSPFYIYKHICVRLSFSVIEHVRDIIIYFDISSHLNTKQTDG